MLAEVGTKLLVVFAAELLEESCAGFGEIDFKDRFVVEEPFRGCTGVRTEISVGGDLRAVGMKGIDIGGQDFVVVTRIISNAIEVGREAVIAKEPQVFDEGIAREFT